MGCKRGARQIHPLATLVLPLIHPCATPAGMHLATVEVENGKSFGAFLQVARPAHASDGIAPNAKCPVFHAP